MTLEEKQLLIKDLCARVPYVTFVYVEWHETEELEICEGCEDDEEEPNIHTLISCNYYGECDLDDNLYKTIYDIKPYLRPLSSMTAEEYYEFRKISGLRKDGEYFSNHLPEWGNSIITERVMVRTIDWLNAHHFDYRGLIPMGLALESPKDMYKTE